MSASRLTTIRSLLAVGSLLLLLAAVAPVAGYDSCSPGYHIYSTSNDQCCPEGYPYVYNGKCNQCDYGSVYDSYSGYCCPESSPYYYDGACHRCRYGSVYDSYSGYCCPESSPYYYDGACHRCRYGSVYDSYSGYCCPEGYPHYYDGTCHAMSESASSGTGVVIPEVSSIPAVFSTAPTPTPAPAPVVVIVNVPATPTKTPLPWELPVLGIGILCLIGGCARKNR